MFFNDSEHYCGEPYLLLLAANQYGRVKQWEWVRQILQRLWQRHPECEVTDQLAHHSLANIVFDKRTAKPYIRRLGKNFLENIRDERWRKEVEGLLSKVAVFLVISLGVLFSMGGISQAWAGSPEPVFRFCVDDAVEDAVREIVGQKQHFVGEIEVLADSTPHWKQRILKADERCDVFLLEGSDVVRMIRKQGPFKGAVILPVAQTHLSISIRSEDYNSSTNPVQLLKTMKKGRLVTLDPVQHPGGVHAEYAMKTMGLWNAAEKLVRYVSSNREAVNALMQRKADMVMLYRSVVAAEPNLKEILVVPEEMTLPIVYFGVVPDGGKKRFHAYRWLQNLSTQDTAEIWQFFHFFPPVGDDTVPQEFQE